VNGTLTDTLTRLAQSIESLLPAGAQPAWVEILGPLKNPEGVRWHPDIETMIGFVAPSDCNALAAVGYGWARSLGPTSGYRAQENPEGSPLLAPGERRRCRVVCLCSRQGDLAGYVRAGGGILIDEPPTVGRIPDFMRRCFRLPTAAPEESTDGFLASAWLTTVVVTAELSPTPLPWPVVARMHPALQVAEEAGLTIAPGQVLSALRTASEVWSWSYLARQAASPGWLADLLPSGGVEWMDEGILSRWLLSCVASVDQLLPRVTPLIATAAAKRLRTTLWQLGILGTRHPDPPSAPNS
jgi:hypothetical protein